MITDIGEELLKCCGSVKWVEQMAAAAPEFRSKNDLLERSDKIWFSLEESDWLEAFSHHPRIGDLKSLNEKYTSTLHLAGKEQSGFEKASMEILKELAEYNDRYEKKFGYIFIVCATGKSAEEMLAIVKDRINNEPEEEIMIAVQEQNKITRLRLNKIIEYLI